MPRGTSVPCSVVKLILHETESVDKAKPASLSIFAMMTYFSNEGRIQSVDRLALRPNY